MGTDLHCANIVNLFEQHCVDVSYAEYLPPSVIYQYEGEPIKEIIEADDYTIDNGDVTNCQTLFRFNWSQCDVYPPFKGIVDTTPDGNFSVQEDGVYGSCGNGFGTLFYWNLIRDGVSIFDFNFGSGRNAYNSLSILDYEPYPSDCIQCKFTAYKNGKIIYQETRSECPIFVDVLPCKLDQTKNFDVTVEPWEFLLLTSGGDGQLSTQIAEFFSFIDNPWFNADDIEDYIDGNPDECIMVWKFKLPFFPTLIGQYCSPIGCPPPEYQVICRDTCEAEKCPSGTCEVECTDHICCYDSEGTAILTIDK